MATPIIEAMRRQFPDADFAYIYISEAHARDEWPLGQVESFDQPTSLEERLALARRFEESYAMFRFAESDGHQHVPVFVDSMTNEFEERYAVWPERFFIIGDKMKLDLVAEPFTELGFDRSHLSEWLHNRFPEVSRPTDEEKSAAAPTTPIAERKSQTA